jgi:superfamily II DNA helicase RecQ
MQAGQTSYAEVSQLFDPQPEHFEDTQQALVFAEDYVTVHNIADELRKHHKLTGDEAAQLIAIYHSLLNEADKARIEEEFREGKIRILVSTEALTMVSFIIFTWHTCYIIYIGSRLSKRSTRCQFPVASCN